jgi:hypothetical protein
VGDWRGWVIGSTAAVRIGRTECVLAVVALATAATIALATLATDRPIPRVGALLFVAFPLAFAGQVWGLATLSARRSNWREMRPRDPRRFFFEGLPALPATALVAVFVFGWIAGMLTFQSLTSGGPTSGVPSCPYRLVNHGSYKCVSQHTYVHVGAAEQRFAASIFAGFFAIQLGMSAAELRRRRATPRETVRSDDPRPSHSSQSS